jgi:peptide/nickel transport system substrate-binding protein/oligopeptide transport system substrate-binding protein
MQTSKRRLLPLFGLVLLFALIIGGCAQGVAPPPAQAPAAPSTAMPAPATYTPSTGATAVPAATSEPSTGTGSGMVNAFGVELPADAAPPEQQYIVTLATEGTTCDFAVSVYKRTIPAYCNVLATPLLRINKNFEILPAGAESWEGSPDGMTWTFHLDPNLKWSDGNPVTAHDYVFTFQYQADPAHAWDFAWFWSPIKNWDEAVKGEVPVTDIGVRAVDDFTLEFTTEAPAPYLPAQALYARPLSKVAFEKSGEFYNNTPETSVSSSPWILEEWTKGKQMVFGPNLNYTGKNKPFLEKMIILFGDQATDFTAYQNNEVDHASAFTPADIELISNDPELSKEYHPGFGDFRTYYLGFNTFEPPFDDIKVRQAFAKAIDRDAIINNVVKRQGIPAYSFLMPGFPDASADVLKNEDVNKFDVAAAKQLLADAGYPDGEGFPAQELWLRQENPLNQAVGSAIAAMITENLGIPVEVSNKETKVFMDSLNAHTLPFYMVSYGFDYLDPSNMLGIWNSSGRHAWKNDEFDKLVTDASAFSGDPAERSQMFKDAEKILVNDVPAVFIYHVTPGWVYKPYVKGEEFEPDKTGVTTWHWPGLEDINMMALTTYISNEVDQYRK